MKLAYLVSEYPAVSHTFIYREIQGLRRKGMLIHTFSVNDSGVSDGEMADEIFHTFYIKSQGVSGAIASLLKGIFFYPAGFLKGIIQIFRLGKFDLSAILFHFFYFVEGLICGFEMNRRGLKHLHVHFGNPAATVALYIHQIFQLSYSITFHGPDIFDNVILNHLQKKIEEAKFVFCIGDFCRSQLMKISSHSNWDKLSVVPLGTDVEYFKREKLPKNERPHLLTVGRLCPQKGQKILIEALAMLDREGIDFKQEIIGDGPDRPLLQQWIVEENLEGKVILLGSKNPEEVCLAYQAADIFVLSSFAEGVPIVLMEAMAMELPCVATRVTGVPELITEGQEGLLVNPSSSKELYQALKHLIFNPSERQRLGKASREKIRHKYNLKKNIETLYQAFTEHLAQ